MPFKNKYSLMENDAISNNDIFNDEEYSKIWNNHISVHRRENIRIVRLGNYSDPKILQEIKSSL